MFDWKEFDKWQAALCGWREARGEGRDGIRAVIHVIANRAKLSGRSWAQEVYRRLQFSSMTYGQDPQLSICPHTPDAIFSTCYEIADAVMAGTDPDLTQGATFYYATSISAPAWVNDPGMEYVGTVGSQKFYRGSYS